MSQEKMREMEIQLNPNHAISRAFFFLEQAEKSTGQRDEHYAYLEATILFGYTALGRLKTKHGETVTEEQGRRRSPVLQDRICRRHGKLGRVKHPDWDSWWGPLKEGDLAVHFFENERHWIAHHGPSQVGQRLGAATVHDSFEYESGKAAVVTVRRYLERLKNVILEGERKFESSPDLKVSPEF